MVSNFERILGEIRKGRTRSREATDSSPRPW